MSDDHRPDLQETEGPENDAREAEAATEAAAQDTLEQAEDEGAQSSEDEGRDDSEEVATEDESTVGEEESKEPAPEPAEKLERLQKILAQAGIASRRHAEELITEGRVQVNGKVVTELGSKADAVRDHIRVDGKLLQGSERLRYFMLNKPKGFVTTVSDPEKRPTVMEFFAKIKERVYPVGRLDYLSEGLLLMTNDGELANKLTRAASGVDKTYLVKVSGEPSEEAIERLRGGVGIDREKPGSGRVQTSPAQIRQVRRGDNPWYEVVLIEGRNRELRKMFEEIGHHVEKIRRVGYGPLVLDVEPGKLRELQPEEVEELRKAADGKLRKPKKDARKRSSAAEAQLPTVKPRWTPKRPDGRGERAPYRGPERLPAGTPEGASNRPPYRAPDRTSSAGPSRAPGFAARRGLGTGPAGPGRGRPAFGADRAEGRGPYRAPLRTGDARNEGAPYRRPERGAAPGRSSAGDRPRPGGGERGEFRSMPQGEIRPSPRFGGGRPPRSPRSDASRRPFTPASGQTSDRPPRNFGDFPPRERGAKPAWKNKPERGTRPPRFDRDASAGPGTGRPASGPRPDRPARPSRFGGNERPAPAKFRPRPDEDIEPLEPTGPKKRLEIHPADDDFGGRGTRPPRETRPPSDRPPFTPRTGSSAGPRSASGAGTGRFAGKSGPRPQFDRGGRPPSAPRPASDAEEGPRFDRPRPSGPRPSGPGAPRREFGGANRPGTPSGGGFVARPSGDRPGGRPAGRPATRPSSRPAGRPGGKPAGRSFAKPGARPGGKPGGRSGGKAAGKRFGGKPGGGKKRG